MHVDRRIPVEYLMESFELKEDGVYWRQRPVHHFTTTKGSSIFNSLFAGKRFGTVTLIGKREYRMGGITYQGKAQNIYEHTIVWVLSTGKYPEFEIDHKNRDGLDNAFPNLRDVPHIKNANNKGMYINNTSGVTGVYWKKRENRWVASGVMYENGKRKQVHLGGFHSFDSAVEARKQWEDEMKIASYSVTE